MRTFITAHSGAENTRDNTLESIRAICECGADIIEVDVRRHEGVLVLSHDSVMEGESPAALEDCFLAVKEHVGLKMNLDLKQMGLAADVWALAVRCGVTDRLIFTGDVGEEDFPTVRAHGIEVCYNDNLAPAGFDPLQCARDRGVGVLNICWRDVTIEMLSRPECLSLWTVDDPAELARFLGRGVYNITTRHPALALRLRAMIEGFHKKWDAFPGSARLVDREGVVLAANEPARRAGFVEGARCATVKTANNHRDCLLRRAFESGEGQANVTDGMMRCWVPVDEWDGAMLHLSFKSPNQ